MATAKNSRSRRGKRNDTTNTLGKSFARIFLAGLCVVLLISAFLGAIVGLNYVFRTHNPFFTLEKITVRVRGNISKNAVADVLKESNILPGQSNLFEIDPEMVRNTMKNSFIINFANVKRRLPNELIVEIYEKQPVARFIRPNAKLIDAEGWLLPPNNDEMTRLLPLITCVSEGSSYEVGDCVTEPMVSEALEFINHMKLNNYDRYFDIEIIQLEYKQEFLKLFLRPKGTFRSGGTVLVPVEGMEKAMSAIVEIAATRTAGNEPTSHIDGTLEIHPYVRP